ncbi:MAG: hypothetical protein LBS76_02470 [Mycoplasmataceae bacterium]|jgi:macrodomain Ter protein organizer (MatP/YcbG family)|nr:hypothetical protein [Mycoplasmataceae bacterium]
MTKQQIIQKYQQLTGRQLTELSDGKVQYIENRKTGQVNVKRDFIEIERYVILKSQPNTSIVKNNDKVINKNINTCINPELAKAVKQIFVPRPNREKYRTIGCSIKVSDYKKIETIAKRQNTTVSSMMKRLVDLVLRTNE